MLEMFLKRINKSKNQKGFTLVELIVVIAILGILAAFAIPKIGGFGDTAKRAKVESEHKMLVSAIQMYQSEKGLDAVPTLDSTAGTTLDPYIEGGTAKINATKNKAGGVAHVISGNKLTSTWIDNPENKWEYSIK